MRVLTPVLLLSLVSCKNEKSSYDTGYASDSAWESDADSDSDSDSDTDTDLGSEEEQDDFLKLEPAATDAYVFVVNSTRNTLSRIAVPGLDVRTTTVGVNPTLVATSSDQLHAVTFNAGSDDLSIVNVETLAVDTVAVRDNFNAMELSPDGSWVTCFHDARVEADDNGSSDGGLQSFNEISVVNLGTLEHTAMAVGFNPRQVVYTPDSGTLVVASDAWLAVLDLTSSDLTPQMVQLSEDVVHPPVAEEIVVDPQGQYLFVRQYGAPSLLLVDLLTLETTELALSGTPTDLDLSPDGNTAAVVVRGSNELVLIDTRDPQAQPLILDLPPDELLGSLVYSPTGERALLFTTAVPRARVTTWDIEDGTFVVRGLEKPVRSIKVSPDGGTATIFHTLEDAENADPDSIFNGQEALTMVDLTDFRSNALLLPKEPTAFVNSGDGRFGFFVMAGSPYLEVLRYEDLLYDEVRLKSSPVHVGVLPGSTYAYVNEEHELGRLSFYEPDTGELKTITGFELNSGIEH